MLTCTSLMFNKPKKKAIKNKIKLKEKHRRGMCLHLGQQKIVIKRN